MAVEVHSSLPFLPLEAAFLDISAALLLSRQPVLNHLYLYFA